MVHWLNISPMVHWLNIRPMLWTVHLLADAAIQDRLDVEPFADLNELSNSGGKYAGTGGRGNDPAATTDRVHHCPNASDKAVKCR